MGIHAGVYIRVTLPTHSHRIAVRCTQQPLLGPDELLSQTTDRHAQHILIRMIASARGAEANADR